MALALVEFIGPCRDLRRQIGSRLALASGFGSIAGLASISVLASGLRLGRCFWFRLRFAIWVGLGLGVRFNLGLLLVFSARLRFGFGFGFGRSFRIAFGIGLRCNFDFRFRPGFLDRIKNPIREQFDAVVHEEPQQRITPHEPGPTPAQRRHEQSINRDQGRHDLRAEHRHP